METYILERGYISPNDEGIMAQTDSISIQRAVDVALASNLGKVVIPRYNKRRGECLWEVDEAIILDSNLEIVLDNCYIRQADGSMDNVFRNFRDDEMRNTLAEEQHNIIIRGVGNAVIDGGVHNGLTEANSLKDGMPHIEQNNVIRLHNLRDFRIENFSIYNQRWWAINLLFAEEGRISGLNIVCESNARNLDGVDLRLGCNNIVIENMTGQSGDDFIALTGLSGGRRESDKYNVEGKSIDIHDVVIRNIVATSTECTVIALRNDDGVKMHNITIDTVYDTMSSAAASGKAAFVFGFDDNRYQIPKSPYAVVRIGQDGFTKKKRCAPGDVHSIHVNNIHARCNCAVMINMDMENCYFGNIYAANDVDRIVSARSARKTQTYGVNMRNTVFENIFYECTDNEYSTAFDFDINTRECTMENVIIRNAFLGNCKRAVNMQHKGTLTLINVQGKDVKNRIAVGEGATVNVMDPN